MKGILNSEKEVYFYCWTAIGQSQETLLYQRLLIRSSMVNCESILNQMLRPHQLGFRKRRSKQHAFTLLLENVKKNIDKGTCDGAVYIDLRKTFVTVHHASLLEDLPSYCIVDVELRWICDYLFNRKQKSDFR